MNKDKINEILMDVSNKSNKDLFECKNILLKEFDKTKQLIIDLTRHLDIIEENYNILNNEINKRTK